jgi:Domain of unknown function (DUF4174)
MMTSSVFLRLRRSISGLLPIALFSALVVSAHAQNTPSETDSRRVLEISVPSIGDELYARQAALVLPHWRGLLERDIEIVTREGAAAFKVRLIGKDGGEKLAAASPVSTAELFALIDAMPMRKAEMKNARQRD